MKNPTAKLIGITATLLLTMSGAFAHEDYTDAGSLHWLQHIAETKGEPSARALAAYGYASDGTPSRIIDISAQTTGINVTRLETVALRYGTNTVVWTFDTLGTRSFPLSKVIPDAKNTTVFVEENPLYRY